MQRRVISDHVKKNSEFHLKLACERLQELRVSSTLTAASIQEVQTETATAMKKIKELSDAVLKSEGLQDLSDRVAERKEKLQELQSREDASDRLSALQDDVFSIKKEVKELSRNVSVNAKLLELQDEINNLQKLIPRVNVVAGTNKKLQQQQEANASLKKENSANLQVLRKEVAGTNTKLQKLNEELNEAIIRMEERNFDANSCSLVLSEIDSAKLELRRLREDTERNRNLDKFRIDRWEMFSEIILTSIFCIAVYLVCFRFGTVADLYSLIMSIFYK